MKTAKLLKMIERVKQDIPKVKINILEKHPDRHITTMFDVIDQYNSTWRWSDNDKIVSNGFTYEYHFWNFCLDVGTIEEYKKKVIYLYVPYTNVDCDENYIDVLIFIKRDGGITICEMDYLIQGSAATFHFLSKAELKDYFVQFVENYKLNNVDKTKVEQETY